MIILPDWCNISIEKRVIYKILTIEQNIHTKIISGEDYINNNNVNKIIDILKDYQSYNININKKLLLENVKELLYIIVINGNESRSYYLDNIIYGEKIMKLFCINLLSTNSWYKLGALIEYVNCNINWECVYELNVYNNNLLRII